MADTRRRLQKYLQHPIQIIYIRVLKKKGKGNNTRTFLNNELDSAENHSIKDEKTECSIKIKI